jgi:hypothetical protein
MKEKTSWAEKPYRGRTSTNIYEMLDLTNKQALITTIAVVGGLGLLIFLIVKRKT